MAKFPTYEEIVKKVAEKALDEFLYNGKSIREWMQIITSEDAVSRKAVLEYIEGSEAELGHSSENELVCQHIKELPPVTLEHCTDDTTFKECALDKIRAEIGNINLNEVAAKYEDRFYGFQREVIKILDKYKAESEGTE